MLLNTSKRTARYSFRSLIYAFCLTCAFWAASQGQNPPIIIKAIKSLLHTILWKFPKCFVYFCGWAGLLLHFTSVLNDLLLSFSFLSHPAMSQLNILDLCLLQNFLDPLTCFLELFFFPRQKVAFKKNLRRCTRLGHFSFRPSLCFFQLGEFLGHSRQRLALVAGLKLPGDGEVEACRCQVLLLLFGRCHYGQLWSNWLSWTFQLTNVLALLMLFKWKSLY